ncbi:toprim domain-containing protein [Prevotella intermedia]|uniref:Mobilization protein n=1 Tax=Prevotella intermedia TaxID=28131 RepID=A0A2D3LJG6_PREIN|nr:toprim domain-containing protein [Prevotella intermedia]ATV30762.1 mobilization protein [Prevotella intermedia]PJI22987.1 mobilization protein [Prevotella intermedia]
MKSRFYDLQYIKAIPIADYLHACGIKPAKRYNGYALYHAPYREDPNASLKVDFRQNLWHDYGTSQGGSIIDLVMKMRGCSAYEAIAHLAEGKATTLAPSSFHREAHIGQRRDEQRPNNTRRILSINEALPLHLQSYLREVRKIDLAVASPYLHHVRYEVGGREYSAIGFPNRAGGYELRDDKIFKGTIAPKDISVIAGQANNAPLCIFEGVMDFLSLLTMKGKEAISPSIVLNSVSNIHRAVAYLHEKGIDSVRAFFDNDPAGRQALQAIQSTGIKVEDMSRHYSRYKDLNECHIAQRTGQKQVIPPRKRGLRR